MFAYCANNPVVFYDPSGRSFCVYDGGGTKLININRDAYFGGGGGSHSALGASGRAKSLEVIQREIKYYNNTSEKVVLESDAISFYKGVPVMKVPFMGTDAFSCGVVFLGSDVSKRSDSISLVQHEYGHAVHFAQIGAPSYTAFVAVPSIIGYWSNIPTEKYYSQPWEYCADVLGGVSRTYRGVPYPYTISEWQGALYWFASWIFS